MKNILTTLLAAIAILCCGSTASLQAKTSKTAGLKVLEYKIKSLRPESMRAVRASIELRVQNDQKDVQLSGIKGTLIKNGRNFVNGSCADVFIASGVSTIVVDAYAELCPGIGLLDVLQSINFNVEEYTTTFSFTLGMGAKRFKISKKNMPLKNILH